MAQKTLTARLVIRNDTQANWNSQNPILLKGEIGLVSDKKMYKVGDGVSAWDALTAMHEVSDSEYLKLVELIAMLDGDAFGKVDDVTVDGESVLDANDKTAKIHFGELSFAETSQSEDDTTFKSNVVLHKVAASGKYADLIGKLVSVDSLDSESTIHPLSANQGRILNNKISQIPNAKSYENIEALVTSLNALDKSVLNVGTNLYIQALEVPDFWVYSSEEANIPYTYTTDADLVAAINTYGYAQIGYYKISKLETEKIDLSDYVTEGYLEDVLDFFAQSIRGDLGRLEEQLGDIETLLRSTDTFILDGGNSNLGG